MKQLHFAKLLDCKELSWHKDLISVDGELYEFFIRYYDYYADYILLTCRMSINPIIMLDQDLKEVLPGQNNE